MPTFLDIAKLDIPDGLDGNSLIGVLPKNRPVFFEHFRTSVQIAGARVRYPTRDFSYEEARRRGVRVGEIKLVERQGGVENFLALDSGLGERIVRFPDEVANPLRRILREGPLLSVDRTGEKSLPSIDHIDPHTREKMRALGYFP